MNEATKQFFVRIYLQQVTNAEYVDWAIVCLEEGFDSKSVRLLAGLNKNHNIKADFEDLFHQSLKELGWSYLEEKEVLLDYSKDLANKILNCEIKPDEGAELISKIYIQLHFPFELEYWINLSEGSSDEWLDQSLIPGVYKFNYTKWLEAVMREAKFLTERNFLR